MRTAITRGVSPAIGECELTHFARTPIDLDRAREEHRQYEACLERLGCAVRRLAPEPTMPDSVFVEDAAVVLPELAVITRPGAASRRAETASIAAVLGDYRHLEHLGDPATLDGGDVLVLGRSVHVGRSARSNTAGVAQLDAILRPFGYTVTHTPLTGCLHLKSAVCRVAEDALLLNPDYVDPTTFSAMRVIAVDPAEPNAACVLYLDRTVIIPAACPRTRDRLEAAGIPTMALPLGELAKAEAGVTCCSLIIED